ncbi:zinc finger protein 260-like [Maniola hyperantus]|uniref:zinc finger protein 260-like n=1 Tax=Aphantopus hyperantus TaxID=2795564 RepID=UPI0015697B04|nr:zinc finger protein 287-like [Maniola hyperantus]
MVTSFYIMKMNEKTISMEEYYNGLLSMPLPVFSKHLKRKTKCRACLQEGDVPITNVSNYNEMREALHIFGDIQIDDDDDNPTYLCNVCYKFLKSAILFRKIAYRTNVTLRQSLLKQSPDHHSDYDYNVEFEDNANPVYLTFECKKEPEAGGGKVECPICKQVLSKSYYKKHLEHHNQDSAKPYECDTCGKSFKAKSLYQRHRERHETRYLFKCQLCPYIGRYKERLSMHMRVHTGDLKHLCTQCPARYINRSSLNDHMKFRHTEPQHKCDLCNKAYYDNLNLRRHIDVAHLGIKNHECNLCGKKFGYRTKMLAHQRNIHETFVRPHVRKVKRNQQSQ